MDWTQWVAVGADLMIIFMGLLLGLAGLAVVLFMWFLYRRVGPILDQVRAVTVTFRETAHNIQGTTAFVGEQAVTPIIRTVGFVNGVRRGLQFIGSVLRRGR